MKFNFPVWLQGTPEQQQAEQERQALARASFTRAKLSDAERLIGRGKLLEETALANLELSKGKNKEARILAENQLADALAMQGRFAEAAEVHNDKHRRKYYRDVVVAIEKNDNDKCCCSDSAGQVNGVDVSITPRFEEAKIFSPAHGEMVSLIRCHKCGHRNARKPKSRLLPQQSALASNEVSARANKPLLRDENVLNAAAQ